jgi:predicted transcriptional regulator of viral defense system
VAVRTETGTIQVSTPEAMGAVDLLRYVSAAGGLSHAAMVLAELAEHTDGRRLADAAKIDGEFANAQRLGYLLDHIGVGSQTSPLAVWLDEKKPRAAPLKPGKAAKGCPVNRRWKVIVNEEIEVGL